MDDVEEEDYVTRGGRVHALFDVVVIEIGSRAMLYKLCRIPQIVN